MWFKRNNLLNNDLRFVSKIKEVFLAKFLLLGFEANKDINLETQKIRRITKNI